MDLEVPRSSRGGGTININDLKRFPTGNRFPEFRLGSTWEAPAIFSDALGLVHPPIRPNVNSSRG